jgi:hypothetical protein
MKKIFSRRLLVTTGNVTLAIVMAAIFSLTPVRPAFANLSEDDVDAIYNNWPAWVAGDDAICVGSDGLANDPNSADPSNNAGSWNSGQQPPYILETFMIEVLKDIAAKRGVDPSVTVTEQHVIALVAFAIGEGGDINNHDIFNPLNTGIKAPDLASTEHNASGLQSFKSFDAGVEANARVMTGKNQHRLSDILIKKDSTANQFMKALTYFNDYPGNKLWAEASLPPNDDSYYQERLNLVKQVTRNWNGTAALVIGTPELEFKTHKTVPGKLQFHPGGVAATPSTGALNAPGTVVDGDCPTPEAGGGSGSFVATIKSYAWPTYHHAPYVNPYKCNPTAANDKAAIDCGQKMKPAYLAAVKAAVKRQDYVGGGQYPGVDCGGFVTLVFHDSGADKNYNSHRSNVVSQRKYLNENSSDSGNGKKYKKMDNISKASQLRLGDIFINGDASHTYIFTGSGVFKGYDAVSASFSTSGESWRTPMASNAYDFSSATWYRPMFPLN